MDPLSQTAFDRCLQEVTREVEQVYLKRDLYFKHHPVSLSPAMCHLLAMTKKKETTMESTMNESLESTIETIESLEMDKKELLNGKLKYLTEWIDQVADRLTDEFRNQSNASVKKKKKKIKNPTTSSTINSNSNNTSSQVDPLLLPSSKSTDSLTTIASSSVFSNVTLAARDPVSLDYTLTQSQKAAYFYLRGHLYNVLPYHTPLAEEYLTRSCKLQPECADVWNSLGECYWKKGDLKAARSCFEAGISHNRNKSSLQKLSMIFRQLGKDDAEKRRYLEDSIALSHEAAKMDVQDGFSWLSLGNAYLKRFFNVSHDLKDIRKALNSYNHALSADERMRDDPDLYRSRAIVYEYLEHYQEAFVDYVRAFSLDPVELDIESRIENLHQYIVKTHEVIQKRAYLKPKRLAQEVATIRSLVDASFQDLEEVVFADLQSGISHSHRILFCKILSEIYEYGPSMRRSFVVVGKQGDIFGLTLYNLAQGCGFFRPGDEVGVAHPESRNIEFEYGQFTAQWTSVRVENPLNICVQGRLLPQTGIASVWVSTSTRAS